MLDLAHEIRSSHLFLAPMAQAHRLQLRRHRQNQDSPKTPKPQIIGRRIYSFENGKPIGRFRPLHEP